MAYRSLRNQWRVDKENATQNPCIVRSGLVSEGIKYSLVACPTINKFVECKDEKDAFIQASAWSKGGKPVFHQAHSVGGRDHYHLADHNYVRFDHDPSTLYNMHFQYGPKITKAVYNSRTRY